jgi:hypothetical protein
MNTAVGRLIGNQSAWSWVVVADRAFVITGTHGKRAIDNLALVNVIQ